MVVDGVTPGRVERPTSPEQLVEALRAAAEAGEAVIPVGGGRAMGIGDPPERFDVALETRGLNRMIEVAQHDLVVSVEAGVTLEELNEELAKVGQFLPADPFNSPGHTVGGLLATGISGPLRLRYGAPRDFVIGLRVALPDGRLASSGGRVVKNVSGYDMNKLHQGAFGSLGVIVAASFKVFPRPLHEVTLETHSHDPWPEAERTLGLPAPPAALELFSDGRLLATLAGPREAVERMAAELGWPAAAAQAWQEHSRRAPKADEAWARISVPPSRLRATLAQLPDDASWWASPGVGVAHWQGRMEAGAIRTARSAAEGAGGSLVLLAGPPELKRQVGAWGSRPATLDWMRRLKESFDPGHCLQPGRYVV